MTPIGFHLQHPPLELCCSRAVGCIHIGFNAQRVQQVCVPVCVCLCLCVTVFVFVFCFGSRFPEKKDESGIRLLAPLESAGYQIFF